MKLLLMITMMSISVLASAEKAPLFSAFANGDDLYVTILADSCNNIGADLIVADSCKDDRLTRNFASVCFAELEVSSTKMACHDLKSIPKVLVLSLKDSNVAKEAELLKLVYQNQTIDVLIK